jgi:hypothetical protein
MVAAPTTYSLPPACSVCRSPQLATIDADIARGLPVRGVALTHGFSASAIQRHKVHSIRQVTLATLPGAGQGGDSLSRSSEGGSPSIADLALELLNSAREDRAALIRLAKAAEREDPGIEGISAAKSCRAAAIRAVAPILKLLELARDEQKERAASMTPEEQAMRLREIQREAIAEMGDEDLAAAGLVRVTT